MRFQPAALLATLSAISGVLATPTRVVRTPSLVERDVATITSIVADISAKVSALDDDIKAYTGGDVSAVTAASEELVQTITDGTATVQAQPALGALDALNLVTPIQNLQGLVETTIDDLIAQKAKVVAAGAGATVLDQLNAQLTATKAFAAALTSKVPESLAETAQALSDPIIASIQKGVTAYEDTAGPTSTTTTTAAATSTTTTAGETTTTTSAEETTTTTAATSTTSSEAESTTPCETSTVPTVTVKPTTKPASSPCLTYTSQYVTSTIIIPSSSRPVIPTGVPTGVPTGAPVPTGTSPGTSTTPSPPVFTGAAAVSRVGSTLAGVMGLGAVALLF